MKAHKLIQWLALVVTVAWIVGFYLYSRWNWGSIIELDPNELGDFLAGAFAPPAFMWLIIGYFLQATELRHQIEELRHQVEATRQLTSNARVQTERNKASVQPRFMHRGTSHSGTTMFPRIWNFGAKALNVSMEDAGGVDLRIPSVIDTNANFDINVPDGEAMWFTIRYDDIHGDRHAVRCHFEEHTLTVFEPVPDVQK